MVKISPILFKGFKLISPLLYAIVGGLVVHFINTMDQDMEKYDSQALLARPYLKIGRPIIDSIIFYFDSTAMLEYLSYENVMRPEKTMHGVLPKVTVFYTINVLNRSDYVLYRFGECSTDSFTTSYFLRDKLFDPQIQFTEPENPFDWNKLAKDEPAKISFSQNINFPVTVRGEPRFALHINILYQSEYNVLFDSYFTGKYSFKYPKNNLIISKRTQIRTFQKGYFRIKGEDDNVKLYYAEDDTKIFTHEEAMIVYQKANYYHQKYSSEKLLLKRY